jgi:hypothetical protein
MSLLGLRLRQAVWDKTGNVERKYREPGIPVPTGYAETFQLTQDWRSGAFALRDSKELDTLRNT